MFHSCIDPRVNPYNFVRQDISWRFQQVYAHGCTSKLLDGNTWRPRLLVGFVRNKPLQSRGRYTLQGSLSAYLLANSWNLERDLGNTRAVMEN